MKLTKSQLRRIEKENEEKPWSCEKCGSTNQSGVFRGDTQCFKCFKEEIQ